jgi:hypothetical protein
MLCPSIDEIAAAEDTGGRVPSPDEIAATVTEKGGWTREQLAKWGIPWPPPHGWKRELENRYAALHGLPVRRAKIRPRHPRVPA